jgi:hypothetical protein
MVDPPDAARRRVGQQPVKPETPQEEGRLDPPAREGRTDHRSGDPGRPAPAIVIAVVHCRDL